MGNGQGPSYRQPNECTIEHQNILRDNQDYYLQLQNLITILSKVQFLNASYLIMDRPATFHPQRVPVLVHILASAFCRTNGPSCLNKANKRQKSPEFRIHVGVQVSFDRCGRIVASLAARKTPSRPRLGSL